MFSSLICLTCFVKIEIILFDKENSYSYSNYFFTNKVFEKQRSLRTKYSIAPKNENYP